MDEFRCQFRRWDTAAIPDGSRLSLRIVREAGFVASEYEVELFNINEKQLYSAIFEGSKSRREPCRWLQPAD
jgi:hypothetical protein